MITGIILLLVVAATGASVGAKWDEKIIGGNNTTIEEHPYQVSLQWDGKHNCGGSILTPNYILTAAHCVVKRKIPIIGDIFFWLFGFTRNIKLDPNRMAVRVGSTKHNTGGQLFRVSNFIYHEDYNNVIHVNDIALVKLGSNIVYGFGIQSIRLANYQVKGGEQTTVTGWGYLNQNKIQPDVLQSLRVPVIANAKCMNYFEYSVTKDMVCAGYIDADQGTNNGDSGGPLVFEGKQIGVVSGAIYTGGNKLLGVFTNVFSYRNWIAQKIGTEVSEL